MGVRNTLTTPEICLSMMTDFVIAPQGVQPHSYVAFAIVIYIRILYQILRLWWRYRQHKFIVPVAKYGNPLDADDTKQGNCNKRDRQIVLRAFLQEVGSDEEHKIFNWIWRVTDVSPDRYEFDAYMWMLIPKFSRFLVEDGQLYGA